MKKVTRKYLSLVTVMSLYITYCADGASLLPLGVLPDKQEHIVYRKEVKRK